LPLWFYRYFWHQNLSGLSLYLIIIFYNFLLFTCITTSDFYLLCNILHCCHFFYEWFFFYHCDCTELCSQLLIFSSILIFYLINLRISLVFFLPPLKSKLFLIFCFFLPYFFITWDFFLRSFFFGFLSYFYSPSCT